MIELLLALQLSFSNEKLHHAVIASSIIAHGADLSTTSWALGKSGNDYYEANPIMRPFSKDPVALAVAKMSIALGVNYFLIKIHDDKPKLALFIGVLQTVGVGYVAHRNAKLLGLRD